ncbi:uncharacterized protein LOC107369700 [Tetranychus urticae]|uniref:uncharacterized protein LOC107369700 n=1 Tax=Tetranychus urticae TaxID=32264 RepID=UPI00077B90E8|nr:uncharacterized protein LOC107369700 [Tetranychus urticae]
MRSLSSFFILCFVSFIHGISCRERICSQNQTICLYDFGPVPTDERATFTVEVTNPSKSNTTVYEYRFKFDQFPQHDKTISFPRHICVYDVVFASTCERKVGNYTVQVDVWEYQLDVPAHPVGTVVDTFELTDIALRWLEVENDGPVTLDSPITFSVFNRHKLDDPSYEYRFAFDQFPQHDKTIGSTSHRVEYTVTFESSSTSKAGNYTVKVDVWFIGVRSCSIGTVLHTFELSDSITGMINLNRNQHIRYEVLMNKFVSTETLVKLMADIADPTGFFTGRCGIQPANITYKWIINDEVQEESSKVIERTFSRPQLNNISVIITATKTNGSRLIQKSGTLSTTLKSRDLITEFTVDGITEVKVFERLQLDCKIHGGTPPFHYHYSFWMKEALSEAERVEKDTNESFFSIVNYFSEKGTKDLFIRVENDVSSLFKDLTISVY